MQKDIQESLSQKINHRRISYDEVLIIANILGHGTKAERRETID